jgi:GNAT superfamily N-acetyltransferase
VNPELVAIWCAAWARSRGVPPPVEASGAWRTFVGHALEKERYVFAGLEPDRFRALACRIGEPLVFLKVCATPAQVLPLLPAHWRLVDRRWMMAAALDACPSEVHVPPGYTLRIDEEPWGQRVVVFDSGGQTAAWGGLIIEQGQAIFDRIGTEEEHRRRGLATAVMARLTGLAAEQGATRGILVATDAGRALYTPLGWRTLCEYTSAVIPA